MRAERAKRRKKKGNANSQNKDKEDTVTIYNKILEDLGDRREAGYYTSDTDTTEPEDEDEDQEFEIDEEAKVQLALEDATRARWYVISSRSMVRVYWDAFIIIFAIINGIVLPLQMAFEKTFVIEDEFLKESGSSFSIVDSLTIFGVITTVVFGIDIVVAFFSSFINVSTGDEIHELKRIAWNYVFAEGNFWIDFISTVPWDDMANAANADENTIKFFKILGILKIIRVLRIGKVIADLNYT